MALRWLALGLLAALAGCAAPRASTTVMGAGRACDLRIEVGTDHRCAVQHVAPVASRQLLTNSTRAPDIVD